jgi:SET domain-containing protein
MTTLAAQRFLHSGEKPAYIDIKAVVKGGLNMRGVFVSKPIEEHTLVGCYQGKLSQDRPSSRDDHYLLEFTKEVNEVQETWFCDAKDPKYSNWTRLINSGMLRSGTATSSVNCEFVQGNGRIYVEATRDILAGEELLVNY